MRISDWSSDVCSSDLNLHLDMARGQDIFLDQHMVVAERRRRLALARGERVGEIRCRIDLAHPLAAAARNGFDEPGIADLGRSEERRVGHESVSTCRSRGSQYLLKKNTL